MNAILFLSAWEEMRRTGPHPPHPFFYTPEFDRERREHETEKR